MNKRSSLSPVVIGLALFAMFFGSGNLIFPLFLGLSSGEHWVEAFLGFLLSAVFLPLLGVITMILYEGKYKEFFAILGSTPGFVLSALLLTIWIPLGSAPRCIALSYASIATYFSTVPPLWVFSLLYSSLVFVVISGKLQVIDFLGKWVTPLLLGCIAVIFFSTLWTFGAPLVSSPENISVFTTGVLEGYNTMDLIASFFFSATVIHMLAKQGESQKKRLSAMMKASFVVTFLLGIVYMALIVAASSGAEMLASVDKEKLLSFLAYQSLGPLWSFVAIGAITLACFSTSVALILAYADFLQSWLFARGQGVRRAALFTLLLSFLISLTGLSGITMITAPVLQVCYPLLILLTTYDLVVKLWKARQQALS